ncbi:hypothetical protein TUMEXPCC7403_15165 [Tumidithrix helvetica PCC 7403]|uniref:BrnT family toxin n=1 Tax=Tumidithrix helvetica TaxID=3457545 RepID=UPI003C920DD4
MELTFEWDEQKETENIKKYGISFQEGKTVFNDPLSITLSDPIHSIDEDRFIDLVFSNQGRLLIVVYPNTSDKISKQ